MTQIIGATSLVVVFVLACSSIPINVGSGAAITETREVGEFTSVVLKGQGEATVTQGDSFKVQVEAQENLLQNIETVVENDVLIIRYKENTSTTATEPIKFNITAPQLKSFSIEGIGSANFQKFSAEDLELNIQGGGKIAAAQIDAGTLATFVHGTGVFELNTVNVSSAVITLEGDSRMTINTLQADFLATVISNIGICTIQGGHVSDQILDIPFAGHFLAGSLDSDTAFVKLGGAGTVQIRANTALNLKVAGGGTVEYYGSPVLNMEAGPGSKIQQISP